MARLGAVAGGDPSGARRPQPRRRVAPPLLRVLRLARPRRSRAQRAGMNLELPGAGRFDNYAQVHCLSFPVDQMVAFTALAMGGVLDRFPSLRVAFLESGTGWVPYFVHRMHEHFEKRPELLAEMKTDPRELLARGSVLLQLRAEEPLLETCVEQLGDNWLIYASDYPHWDSDFRARSTKYAASPRPRRRRDGQAPRRKRRDALQPPVALLPRSRGHSERFPFVIASRIP